MLVTYRGIIQNGKVLFRDASGLPDGTEVVVVVERPYPSVEEQEDRLSRLTVREWQAPFNALSTAIEENPAEADLETVSDEELNELVHRLREK